jgi:hypothetical protein
MAGVRNSDKTARCSRSACVLQYRKAVTEM